jgi:hypothetical protein
MSKIPEITPAELAVIQDAVEERYGGHTELKLADVEVRLYAAARELTDCPAVYWEGRGAHFVVIKVGDGKYRGQFYYRGYEQYGTGIEEYDDLPVCIASLLQIQADHERGEAPQGG